MLIGLVGLLALVVVADDFLEGRTGRFMVMTVWSGEVGMLITDDFLGLTVSEDAAEDLRRAVFVC